MGTKSYLSLYRPQCFGIAAIGIILTHSCQMVAYPPVLHKIFAYGGCGVYIFMFLSGVGLYYSLAGMEQKTGRISCREFYYKRFERVIVPYLLMAGTWYFIRDILSSRDLAAFFYDLSTLSFWLEHEGAWYVAAVIPIYLCYPFLYRFMQRGRRGLKTLALIGITFLLQEYLFLYRPAVFDHLSQVLQSVWIFLLGNYYAEYVKQGKNGYILILPAVLMRILLVSDLVNTYTPLSSILYAYKGVFLLIIFCIVLHFMDSWNLISPIFFLCMRQSFSPCRMR